MKMAEENAGLLSPGTDIHSDTHWIIDGLSCFLFILVNNHHFQLFIFVDHDSGHRGPPLCGFNWRGPNHGAPNSNDVASLQALSQRSLREIKQRCLVVFGPTF